MPKMGQFLKTPKGLRGVVQDATDETVPTEQSEAAGYQAVEAETKPPKKKPSPPSISAMISSMKRKK